MSITKNGNIGPVYQPDIMQLSNIVDSDQIVNASTTLVDIPQLDLNVDANERVLLRYTISIRLLLPLISSIKLISLHLLLSSVNLLKDSHLMTLPLIWLWLLLKVPCRFWVHLTLKVSFV